MNKWEQPDDGLGLPLVPEGYRWNIFVSSGRVYLELQMRYEKIAKLFRKAETHWGSEYWDSVSLDSFKKSCIPTMAQNVLKKKLEKEEETATKMLVREISNQLHNAGDLR